MYNFRSTLLPLPYMAPMVAIYWAACPQDMARPSRCWSPACSCHLVFAFNSIWIWLHKAPPVKTETLMDESTSITKLYPRFHNCYSGPIDFYCWRSQARVQQTWHQGCSGKSGYFCQKQHDSPSCCRAASITKYSLQSQPAEFLAEMQKQPQLVICSVEFLASREVHSYKLYQFHPAQCRNMVTGERYSSRLCPLLTWDSTHHLHRWMPGLKDIQIREPRMWKPLGFVPYCILNTIYQVLDEDYGWCGFRDAYNNSTWRWLAAAFNPRFLTWNAKFSHCKSQVQFLKAHHKNSTFSLQVLVVQCIYEWRIFG